MKMPARLLVIIQNETRAIDTVWRRAAGGWRRATEDGRRGRGVGKKGASSRAVLGMTTGLGMTRFFPPPVARRPPPVPRRQPPAVVRCANRKRAYTTAIV